MANGADCGGDLVRFSAVVYERMFADSSLVSSREQAAVLALLARRHVPWNRLAGAIEEEGSAPGPARPAREGATEQLFAVDDGQVTLDQLEEHVHAWEEEGIELVTVLDSAYPVNLRMTHDRPPALFVRGQVTERTNGRWPWSAPGLRPRQGWSRPRRSPASS